MKSSLITIAALLLCAAAALAQTVSLSWDPSPPEEVTGYKIYYNGAPYSFPLASVIGGKKKR